MTLGAPRVDRQPFKGVVLGLSMGFVLMLVARADPRGLVSDSDLAVVYLFGGALSGLIGGILWPYQRSRTETLIFSIPTAIPPYLLAGHALGMSFVGSLLVGTLAGALYALFHGGQHRASSKSLDA